MTHYVVVDVGSARSDAVDSVGVMTVARIAVVVWIIRRIALSGCCVVCVTPKNLTYVQNIVKMTLVAYSRDLCMFFQS